MPAQTFVLTQTPTKILDGTKAGYVQEIINTGTRFTVSSSNTAPDTSTVPYCKILKNDLAVSAGFPIWAWTPTSTSITVTVLTSEV